MKSRKIFLIVLVILTVSLVFAAVFISIRLNQQTDTSVATGCAPGCKNCYNCGGCANGAPTCLDGYNGCNSWIDANCGGDNCAGDGQAYGTLSCCPGLIPCGNGRCGTSCVGDCTPSGGTPTPQNPCCAGLCEGDGICSECTITECKDDHYGKCGEAPCASNEKPLILSNNPPACDDNHYYKGCYAFAECQGGGCTSLGNSCSTGSECCSGKCEGNVCVIGDGGNCFAIGATCTVGSDCCSGNCSGGVCATQTTSSCQLSGSGVCPQVSSWGGTNPTSIAQIAAQNNPGQAYMASCASNTVSATLVSAQVASDCGCPSMSAPASGCSTSTCSNCLNPVVICASGGGTAGTTSCDGTCAQDSECIGGLICSSGKCRNPSCTEESDCICDTPPEPEPVCNDSCTTSCSDGTSCINGTCRNPSCSSETDCTCDQPPVEPVCNESCTATCSDGTSCINGTCRNPSCSSETDCTCAPEEITYCGDGICQSGTGTDELCEISGSEYRACTAADIAAKRAPTGSVVSTCYGLSTNPESEVTENTCKYCGDGLLNGSEQCDPAIAGSVCNSLCQIPEVQNVCLDLGENGSDPISPGAGNINIYTLKYRHNSTTNPYPNINLRVVDAGSNILGRDNLSKSNNKVAPATVTHDSILGEWTYSFQWEAVNTNGTNVSNGNYSIYIYTNGDTGQITTPGSCVQDITVASGTEESPVFRILKTSTVVCETDGDTRIDYIISVANIGPVAGTLDFVEDEYDPLLLQLGITPTNIVPTGTLGGGKIRWNGPINVSPGQVKTFRYTITITQAFLPSFIESGVRNTAFIQYDTPQSQNNSSSFSLRTFITCTLLTEIVVGGGIIPDTSIFDDGRMIFFGILLISLGYFVYKNKLGKNLSQNLLDFLYNSTWEIGAKAKIISYSKLVEYRAKRNRNSK